MTITTEPKPETKTVALSAKPDLPSPRDFPSRDTVVYDGQCSFCQSQVQRLHQWDRNSRLCFLSLHDPFISENYPDLSHEELMQQMYVLSVDGKRLGGAKALRHLTRRIPRLWPLMPLLHIPFTLPIWQWSYNQIAKRRYRISKKMGTGCDSDGCKIHFD